MFYELDNADLGFPRSQIRLDSIPSSDCNESKSRDECFGFEHRRDSAPELRRESDPELERRASLKAATHGLE